MKFKDIFSKFQFLKDKGKGTSNKRNYSPVVQKAQQIQNNYSLKSQVYLKPAQNPNYNQNNTYNKSYTNSSYQTNKYKFTSTSSYSQTQTYKPKTDFSNYSSKNFVNTNYTTKPKPNLNSYSTPPRQNFSTGQAQYKKYESSNSKSYSTKSQATFNKSRYYSPPIKKQSDVIIAGYTPRNKKKQTWSPEPNTLGNYVSRRKVLNYGGFSAKIIEPTFDRTFSFSDSNSVGEKEKRDYLTVDKGDVVINLHSLGKNRHKFAIAMYEGEEMAITHPDNYVFRAWGESLDSKFLKLIITGQLFDDKLSGLIWRKKKALNAIDKVFWEEFIELELNIPSLDSQRECIKKWESIEELISAKQAINQELEKWMKYYFHSLSPVEDLISKNFKELFVEDKKEETSYLKLDLKDPCGKFIFSNLKDLIINHKCDMYNQKFCKANKLLLSKKVYEDEEREHFLHLWLGCEEFLKNYNLIAFAPLLNVLEIPYSYCLIKEHFNHLIKNIPTATTSSRTITLPQLRNIDFQIHPTNKIIEFNRTCEPIFEYQQALEEEIYKLRKLLEKEEEIINKKIFTRKLN
ncbi:hypothetical protein WEN_02435 [Mycoplasma wenyonii str. Massachusetts]|uniref:Type I restriction modification DNA specificity domain-containing protein n=1 Tax=Mycoplasma wenyonii (strain Massachusetts) TaxID=1197325 RepID=I6YLW9_MYCWM|nr:hypothetical protein [Mycoplasma wenyonii]AFN65274.1 hypothetical protein WEN_02435 [Mycoplasma wenyonii str. Massachusetts]